MPRQPRFWFPGAVLHVVQRGNNRTGVFADDADRRFYLRCLADAATAHGVAIHAYVLMTNHIHLLVSPETSESMPRTMQSLGRRYVRWFNHFHDRTGTLWEGRYKSALVDSDAYLIACMRYIEANPVRAGMVAASGEFAWSSYRANGHGHADSLVTQHSVYASLGSTPASRQAHYRRIFGSALDEDEQRTIRDATRFEWVIGSATFCRTVQSVAGRRTERLPMGPRQRADD